jgi:uncharacterized membrane protein
MSDDTGPVSQHLPASSTPELASADWVRGGSSWRHALTGPRRVLTAAAADVRGARIAWAYLVTVVVWGLVLLVVTPPFQVPDENAHYLRAWSVAELQLVAGNGLLVRVPSNVASLPGRLGSSKILYDKRAYSVSNAEGLLWEPISPTYTNAVTSAASYGPIGYIPQAIGIDVARLIGRSPLLGVYFGRLACLLTGAALGFIAIRLIPVGRPLLALVALLPMVVIEMASLSPDGVAMTGFFLFFALLLRLSKKDVVSTGERLAVLGASCVLLNARPGYVALVPLIFMLRPREYGGWRCYTAWTGATVAASGAVAAAILAVAPQASPSYLTSLGIKGTDSGQQLSFLLQHPWAYVKVLYRTFDLLGLILTQQVYGVAGWLTVALPVIGMAAVVIVGALLLAGRESVTTTPWQRSVMCGTGMVYVLAVCTALYATWSAVWAPTIAGLQGRYFIPAVTLGLFALYGVRIQRDRAVLLVLIIGVALAAITTVTTLLHFYY